MTESNPTDGHPEYELINPPEDVPVEEWKTEERRARVYEELKERGYPAAVNQSRLAEELGVTQPTIHRDLKAVMAYHRDRLGEDADVSTEVLAKRVVKRLLAKGEDAKALDAQLNYMEWLYDDGIRDRAPDQIEQRLEATVEGETSIDISSDPDLAEAAREVLARRRQCDEPVDVEDGEEGDA